MFSTLWPRPYQEEWERFLNCKFPSLVKICPQPRKDAFRSWNLLKKKLRSSYLLIANELNGWNVFFFTDSYEISEKLTTNRPWCYEQRNVPNPGHSPPLISRLIQQQQIRSGRGGKTISQPMIFFTTLQYHSLSSWPFPFFVLISCPSDPIFIFPEEQSSQIPVFHFAPAFRLIIRSTSFSVYHFWYQTILLFPEALGKRRGRNI